MPTKTYKPIATTTLSSAVNTITFSSIPGTYTDLVIINNGSSAAFSSVKMQFNGDTGTNYSSNRLYGDGGSAGADRITSNNGAYPAMTQTDNGTNIINVMNYSQGNTYKTAISRSANTGSYAMAMSSLWRSNSAITSVTIFTSNGTNFSSGSTFTIYGIL